MQTLPSALVRLPFQPLGILALAFTLLSPPPARAATAKAHSVTQGPVRKVPYLSPETASPDGKPADAILLKVRPLFVDGNQKEWTTGDAHDVTDRSFTIRRVLRLNDQLPGETAPHWSWQPGPWLQVDRITGHIAALHLPDFDVSVSNAVWFRDYAAYCGTAATVKGGLFVIVAQLGSRRAVVSKQIGKWPQVGHADPVCKLAEWQRLPLRVTFQPAGAEPMTFDVVGAASLIEEGELTDDPTP
jgi:hypothetical protein